MSRKFLAIIMENAIAAIQQTGNHVAELINGLQALGAKFGINVNFTLGNRKNRESGTHSTYVTHADHRGHQTQRTSQNGKSQEITIPELATMVSDELGINEDCALDVLETAFELLEKYLLILDIGGIGILAGHEVNEVRESYEDREDCCEDYCEDCEACGNFNHCKYCSWDGRRKQG